MSDERRLIVFDESYPIEFVPLLPKKDIGDFESERGLRILDSLTLERAYDIAWHEAGHALCEHFSFETLPDSFKEIEEHVCRTVFERGLPNILANNPWIRSLELFKKGLKK